MATFYTSKMIENKLNFSSFAMMCARSFGACITMKEEALEKMPPDWFEPDTYHLDNVNKLVKRLSHLKSLASDGEKSKWAEDKIKDSLALLEKNVESYYCGDVQEYKKMLSEVLDWEVPSEEHEGLKNFMKEQLVVSINSYENGLKYYLEEKTRLEEQLKNPIGYYEEYVKTTEGDIEYHTKNWKKELESVKSKNLWIRQLKESLR